MATTEMPLYAAVFAPLGIPVQHLPVLPADTSTPNPLARVVGTTTAKIHRAVLRTRYALLNPAHPPGVPAAAWVLRPTVAAAAVAAVPRSVPSPVAEAIDRTAGSIRSLIIHTDRYFT